MKRFFPLSILSIIIFSGCGNDVALVNPERLPPAQVAAIVDRAHSALHGSRDRLPRQGRVEARQREEAASDMSDDGAVRAERVGSRGAEARAAKVAASGKAGLSPERIAKMKARVAANRAARQAGATGSTPVDDTVDSTAVEPSYDEG